MSRHRFTTPTGTSYFSVVVHGTMGYMDDCFINPPEIKAVFVLFREMIQKMDELKVTEFSHDIVIDDWDFLKTRTGWKLIDGSQRDHKFHYHSTRTIVTIKCPLDEALHNFARGHGLEPGDLL